MSHHNLRFPPEPVLDKVFRQWCEEFRRKNLHLVPKFAGERAEASLSSTKSAVVNPETLTAKTSPAKPLSNWARAWLKVAKGIIG